MFVVGVCGYSLRTAVKTSDAAEHGLRTLRKQLDKHLSSDSHVQRFEPEEQADEQLVIPLGHKRDSLEQEIVSLVDELFQDESPVMAEGAILELFANHKVMKSQLSTVERGLLRVPLLSSVVAVLVISAAMGINKESVTWSGCSLGLGFLTTGGCRWMLSRGRKAAKEFHATVEEIQRASQRRGTAT